MNEKIGKEYKRIVMGTLDRKLDEWLEEVEPSDFDSSCDVWFSFLQWLDKNDGL